MKEVGGGGIMRISFSFYKPFETVYKVLHQIIPSALALLYCLSFLSRYLSLSLTLTLKHTHTHTHTYTHTHNLSPSTGPLMFSPHEHTHGFKTVQPAIQDRLKASKCSIFLQMNNEQQLSLRNKICLRSLSLSLSLPPNYKLAHFKFKHKQNNK